MNQSQIIEKMQTIFDKLFLEPVVLTPELSAKGVEEWDSLMQISIVVAVESLFNIRFKMGEVEATQNVGQFADLIARCLASKAS
ncbi:MAG: acyl carrier protein [Magnetococcales bacterium]|nr:acyl carrier protein [Magnetococcales bacterium]